MGALCQWVCVLSEPRLTTLRPGLLLTQQGVRAGHLPASCWLRVLRKRQLQPGSPLWSSSHPPPPSGVHPPRTRTGLAPAPQPLWSCTAKLLRKTSTLGVSVVLHPANTRSAVSTEVKAFAIVPLHSAPSDAVAGTNSLSASGCVSRSGT